MYVWRSLALLARLLVQHIFSFSKCSLFTFSTNSINNYHIYRFNYFAFWSLGLSSLGLPFSRSSLSAVFLSPPSVLISAVLLPPLSSCSLGCASVTAVVLSSRLCFCHRRRQCSLSRLCFVIAFAILIARPSSTAQKSVRVASQYLRKSLIQSQY